MAIVIIHSTARKAWMNGGTYRLIKDALRQKWENVHSTRAADEAELKAFLQAVSPASSPFVFNIAEYLDEKHALGFLPGLLESWGIPHLGSSARSILRSRDEGAVRKTLVEEGLPVPRFFLTKPPDPRLRERAAMVGYPLTVRQLRRDGAAAAPSPGRDRLGGPEPSRTDDRHRCQRDGSSYGKARGGTGDRGSPQ
jgi:hypothetical protein